MFTRSGNIVLGMMTLMALMCFNSTQAAVITYGNNLGSPGDDGFFGSSTSPVDMNSTQSLTIDLQQFDPSLGTLNSVTVWMTATTDNAEMFYTNFSPTETVNVTLNIDHDLTASGPSSVSVLADPPASTGSTIMAPDSVFSITSGQDTDSDSQTLVNPVDFSPYTGVGLVTFTIDADPNTFASATANHPAHAAFPQANLGDYWGQITVTYDYDPIPEPATLALLGIGGAAMFGGARRNRRKAQNA